MDTTRRSGVLLHPTSLPGPLGRGDLGPEAYRFVEALAAAGQSVWQTLPLGPPGYGGSPYAASSAFAGDTLLISPELLVEEGLLAPEALEAAPSYPEGQVEEAGAEVRRGLLALACERVLDNPELLIELEEFRAAQSIWLEDHALFVALKDAHEGRPFWEWEQPLARHLPPALAEARERHHEAIEREVVAQFLFQRQWDQLRGLARARGVLLFGDLPIFLARDSSDVWARPELFELDAEGQPSAVAGVPPDAFCEDGQLWGNPLYDWKIHARSAYAWWIARFARSFELADWVRVDHFRGFASYWEVPADAATAREGKWVEGPRMGLFQAVKDALGELKVIAEDLGEITDDVPELLAATGFPGMKVLQFAYYEDDAQHPFRPENHEERSAVYTGTHDNETTAGWFQGLDEATRGRVRAAIGAESEPHWGLIELALGSPAALAIFPAQDLLGLDNSARMNAPGVESGNWGWRLQPGQLDEACLQRLRELSEKHGRVLS